MSLWNEVLASDDLVLILGSDTETGGGSLEPERFLERSIDVFELLYLFEFDWFITAYSVDFFSDGEVGSGCG